MASSDHQKFIAQYEAFYVEWWQYYYEYAGKDMPTDHADFRLEPRDDPTGTFAKFSPDTYVCPKVERRR
ncbi:hypothetical protein CYMTET_56244 [Cymbomonas tetramitiformis]|uniref:Uncharacterized protein n=1 Tax=Cymbomonas tetramitiformis TaxID=36881 RepID=A0AAE0BD31_9CHLO|nr:hypothetical protein CYMTET_56244 [Cymbomonas tetramitiformis]